MLAPVTVTACFPPAVSETPGKCWRKTTAGVVSITASDWDGGQTGKNSDEVTPLRNYGITVRRTGNRFWGLVSGGRPESGGGVVPVGCLCFSCRRIYRFKDTSFIKMFPTLTGATSFND